MGNSSNELTFNKKLYPPMILGSILNPINSSMIAIAMIPIAHAFNIPFYQTALLVTSLYLATSIGQPIIGKLIDVFGPKGLFLFATSLVGLASILAIVTPSFYGLVLARFLIGIGTCAGYPSAMYLIKYEGERTGKDSPSSILTVLAISNQTVSVIGPTLGGLLINFGGWEAIFFVNIPLSILCIIFGVLYFPKVTQSLGKITALRTYIDFIGMTFFSITLVTWIIYFTEPSIKNLYLLIIGIVTFIIFIFVELKSKKPFIDVRLLAHNASLNNTYIRSTLTQTISYSVLYGYTQWLEEGRGLSPSHAGLLMLPMFVIAIIASKYTGSTLSSKNKLYIGTLAGIFTMVSFTLINPQTSLIILVLLAALFGVPQGLMNLANQNALYHQAPKESIGMSAGLLRTFMYIGAIVSSTANGIFFKGGDITVGIHNDGIFCASLGVIVLIMTFVDKRSLAKS